MPLILGFPHTSPRQRASLLSHIGGQPTYHTQKQAEILQTKYQCHAEKTQLLLQLYIPRSEDETPAHRTCYLFACTECNLVKCFIAVVDELQVTKQLPKHHPPFIAIMGHIEAYKFMEIEAEIEDEQQEQEEEQGQIMHNLEAKMANIGFKAEDAIVEGFQDGEDYQPTGGDKAFRKFIKTTENKPEQVVRYMSEIDELDEQILWVNDSDQCKSPQRCLHCKKPKTFEFQVLPQILNYIDIDPKDGLDFGTLIIYTCPNDCVDKDGISEQQCFVQQFSEQEI